MRYPIITKGLVLVAILLIIGTAFYSNVENLSLVDAFYFSGSTLTTLGYGDIVPTTDAAKIFTVFYVLIGIGVVFYVFTRIFQVLFAKSLIHSHSKRKRN